MSVTNYLRIKERRQWLQEHHLCIDCKAEDAFTMMGKTRCADCREKARLRESGRQIRREQWSEMGLCSRCGKVPPEEGFKVCSSCREHFFKMSAISHKDDGPYRKTDGKPNPKIPRSKWAANGFCWLCGDPITEPGIKVCSSCHQHLLSIRSDENNKRIRRELEDIFLLNRLKKSRR